jgi:hypothetical protein
MALSLRTRSSVEGWVEKRRATLRTAPKGLTMKRLAMAGSTCAGMARAPASSFQEGLGQGFRVPGERGAALVRFEFPAAGDAELNERRGNGSHQQEEQRLEGVGAPSVATGGAEEACHVGDVAHRRSDGGRNAGNEDVSIFHVGQLVCQHATQLSGVEQLENAFRHRDHAHLRAAAGGKRVGLCLGNNVDARLGDACLLCELLHKGVELRGLRGGDFLRVLGGQDNPVREEVGAEIHDRRAHHGVGEEVRPHGAADGDEERGERPQEDDGFNLVGHEPPPNTNQPRAGGHWSQPGRC